jgi:hypothetical protein
VEPLQGCRHDANCDEDTLDLLAFVYCDKDRHYFISTCLSLAAAVPIQRFHTQQVEALETNADPERTCLTNHNYFLHDDSRFFLSTCVRRCVCFIGMQNRVF